MTTQTAPDIEPLQAQQRLLPVESHLQSVLRHGAITVEPYSHILGGVVSGLRYHEVNPADPALAAFLNDALVKFGFLSFEPGSVSADEFPRFVELFGQAHFLGTPHTPAPAKHANVNTIDSQIKKTRMNFIWHIDQAFRHSPPRFTVLFGKKVPPFGGDTLFASGTAAYDLLDPLFAQYLETLTAVHDVETQGFLTLAYQDPAELEEQKRKNPSIEVPLIRLHPESGRKQIFVNELYTQRITGLSRVASESILNILFDLIKSPDVQARYRWQEGAVLIWDNRTVQHRGVGDYGSGHRVLHRAVVQ